jgi:hypothetical protein
VQRADILGSEVPGTNCEECYVFILLWDLTYLTFVGRQTGVPDTNPAYMSRVVRNYGFIIFIT